MEHEGPLVNSLCLLFANATGPVSLITVINKKFVVRQTASSGMGMREREREREGGGGGSWVMRDELENKLAGRSTLNQRHRCADLPSSWRLTSTRMHSLPRTLVFRGFTSHQLGSSSLTLGLPVDTAFMTSHGHQRTATSGR